MLSEDHLQKQKFTLSIWGEHKKERVCVYSNLIYSLCLCGEFIMRRVNRLEKIDHVIKRVLKGCGIEDEVIGERCLKLWPEIMGKRVADKNKPLYVKDKILFIKSESPVWAKELSFSKKDIIKKINERLAKRFIKDMVFM